MLGQPNYRTTIPSPTAQNFLPSFQQPYIGKELVFCFCNYVLLMDWICGNKSFISRSCTSGKHCQLGTLIFSGLFYANWLTLVKKTLLWTPLIDTALTQEKSQFSCLTCLMLFSCPRYFWKSILVMFGILWLLQQFLHLHSCVKPDTWSRCHEVVFENELSKSKTK